MSSLHAPTTDRSSDGRGETPSGSGSRADRRRGRDRTGGNRIAAVLVFVLPTALAAVNVLDKLGQRQMWRDEHATWWAAELSINQLGTLIRGIDVVFTPYYVLMHVWVRIAGSSAVAMRLPEALAMALAAGLFGLLGRRMFTAQVGLVAGLAFAFVPMVTRYGQEARPYAFAVAAVLLSTLLLMRALGQPSLKVWVGYTLSVPLIGWSHLASLAVLAAHLVVIVTARRRGDRIAGWAFVAAAGLGAAFVLPMLVAGSGQSGQIAWNNPGPNDLLNFPQALFGSWAVATPVMVLGLIGLCFAGRHALPLAVWAVLPPVLTFATAAQLHLFLPRYLLFTVPAWVLSAAIAVCRVSGPVVGRLAGRAATPRLVLGWVLALVAAAVLSWQALPGISAERGPLLGEPDFKGAARIVQSGQQQGDGIAFAGIMTERRGMAYELRNDPGRPTDVLMYRTPQQTGTYYAAECPQPATCLATTRRLWLVSTSPSGQPFLNMPTATATVLQSEFRIVGVQRLANVEVLLLERTKAAKTGGHQTSTGGGMHT